MTHHEDQASTPTPSADHDADTYDGPDSDIASGNITDADFAPAADDAGDHDADSSESAEGA